MVGWIYSLSILFVFQSFEENTHTPSLVELMAEVNDPTSVFNNPGALGFIRVNKSFQIILATETSLEIEDKQLREVHSYFSYQQGELDNNAIVSLYAFGFYFAMKSRQETWFPIIAKRFGNFAAGLKLRDNSLEMGTLLAINNKFRVALAGDIFYDPMEIHGRGGLIYQPFDWYYLGIDVFPHLKKCKIVNSFLNQRFGIDNMSMGLEMDAGSEDFNWDVFIQGVFSFTYLQLAVGWNSGINFSSESIDILSNSYGYNVVLSLNFGF